MRVTIPTAFVLAAVWSLSAAAASPPACEAQIGLVAGELKQANFPTPMKPGMLITGTTGKTMTGAQLGAIQTQLRLAQQKCRAGDDKAAKDVSALIHQELAVTAR